jgi:type IV pilus biogenesis/stability protein PilW
VVAGLGLALVLVAGVAVWLRRAPGAAPAGPGHPVPTGTIAVAAGTALPPAGPLTNEVASQDTNDEQALDLINRGTELLAKGDAAGAVQAFLGALRLTPEDEDLHYNLGIAYARLDQAGDAEKHYREALRLFPDYPEVHNNLGNLLAKTQRLSEAVEQFNEAIRVMPDYASAYNNLGTTLQRMGRLDDAGLKFRKAMELDPDYWEACFNLSNIYRAQNRLEEAAGMLQQVLRLNPAFAPAQRSLMEVRQKLATSQR